MVPAAAQDVAVCPNGVISEVFVDNHSVFDLTDPSLDARFDWAYGLVNRLHIRTREDVIRREILVAAGDCYDIERLRDSERLLRAMPFIAGVDVYGVQQADSTFHVIVDTRDEWSARIEPRFSSGGGAIPRGIRLSEDNLLGTGRHASLFYVDRDEERAYGFTFRTPQFLDSRWDALLEAGRTSVGYLMSQAITYPFVGQTGRWAMTEAVHHQDRYFELWVPQGDELLPLWYPERRRSLDLGAAYRWGTRGQNSTLLGAALMGQWVSYPGQARFGRGVPPGETMTPMPELRMDSVASIRAMVLTGKRSVYYVRRRSLDTVNGVEDFRLGVESAIGVGPSIPSLSRDRDIAINLTLFGAGELAGSLTGMQMMVQGRRNYDTPVGRSEWNDVFGEVNAWSYWRPSRESRHTIVTSVRAVGGWHNVTPFQLTLGSDAGLRGFGRHMDPGGRRVVASLEHRAYLGWPLPDLLDLGGVAFLDAGKIWPGAAPFGVTSPTRVNVGAGLRAAFPPGSRQTLRIDVGVPIVSREGERRFLVSVGMGQVIGSRAERHDRQLQRSLRFGLAPTFITPAEP
ncbi:hypothetical protein BH23GEM6_BH23GEM6_08790 [soil metagenome]